MYINQIIQILDSARVKLSDIKPSEWVEQNVVMGKPMPGPFRYDKTPYTREIIDCFAPDHPARVIAVMKGAQLGFSSGVLYPVCGWVMDQQPGNIMFMVGHDDLVSKSMDKIDRIIDSSGIRHLIRPTIKRNKGGKTGDTNREKQFPGGFLVLGNVNNHKTIRQLDMQYGIIDDFDVVKQGSKESGDTKTLFEQRFAAYADKMKLAYISTPELKQTSNIEPAYLLGDQRRFMVPCPCCGEFITWEWSTVLESDETEAAGITWKVDDNNELISDSVGYICQKCGGFFDDRNKQELLQAGHYQPTAKPSREGYYSYHISSLYAPPGMYDWEHYVRNYLDANPPSGRIQKKYQTFVNLVLGETYEHSSEEVKASMLQKNQRDYRPGTIPERMSEDDGNGKIVCLTCAADMNGEVDDARIDWEILAWSENESTYSVAQGSIGTFVRKKHRTGKEPEDRKKWTYQFDKANSVWDEFDRILNSIYKTDTDRNMKVFYTGLDCGYFSNDYAYPYIDTSPLKPIGLKGKKDSKFRALGYDLPRFKKARERANLFLVEVGPLKDDLSQLIKLNWDQKYNQPRGFMNFPESNNGQYTYNGYFSHFEGEQRVIETKENEPIAARWVKKNDAVQNHFWDVRVYNHAVKEIMVSEICKEYKRKEVSWNEFVKLVLG